MLLAKLYLNSAVYTGTPRYNEALTAAQEVINGGYTLDTNWRRIFSALIRASWRRSTNGWTPL